MVEKKGLVVFDFDGVIGDSVKECYVQSMAAHRALGGKLPENKETEKKFREARPFVKVASDYGVALSMIEANPRINFNATSINAFEAAKARFGAAKQFEEAFYEARKKMTAEHPARFYALQGMFSGIKKAMRRTSRYNHIAIATTKDGVSVKLLLKQYGIHLPGQSIVAKGEGANKGEQLKILSERFGIPLSRTVLVDDILGQVQMAKGVRAKAVLAGWGYNTKRELRQARKERYLLQASLTRICSGN